jgi:hypothetical protein
MPDAHKNFAVSLVATAPSPALSGTSLVVTAADGAKFPTAPFNATICPVGAAPTGTNAEVVRVTAVSTDTFTITRAQESSSARSVIVGDQIFASITAKTLTDAEAQPEARTDIGRRTGAIAETYSRIGASLVAQSPLASGQMAFIAIRLMRGTVVSKITFYSGSTGTVTPTNQWFGLWSSTLSQLGVTNDDTTTAWAANTEKQLTLASPYTVTADGLFYLSCMVTAATVPTIYGITGDASTSGLAPAVAGKDTTHTGLTTPGSAPATATLATLSSAMWGWVA